MASFCHDQYEHPLLWCDDKRRAEQKLTARESLEVVKHRKEAEQYKKLSDRNEYREMVMKYCPWGRPGGGAPSEHIRRGNILLEGLFPESGNDCRKYIFPPPTSRSKRGGGGAPLRSSSGKIITTYKDDPTISFSESMRNNVDINLRYKDSPSNKMQYKMQLDKIIAEKEEMNKRRNSDKVKHDPWGKAGPGGMPWRDPRNVGQSFMQSMGWTDKNMLQNLDLATNAKYIMDDHPEVKEPAEEPTSTEDDQKYKNFLPSCCCVNCCCNCGTKFSSHKVSDTENGKYKFHNKSKQTENQPTVDSQQKNEKQSTFVRQCSKKQQQLQAKNKQGCENEKNARTRMCMINGGVELVPLLARRRALQRPTSLSTTDVTKCPNANKFQESGHLNELCRQIRQKERRIQINKENDVESSQKHFETLDSVWGRPGHGAPKTVVTKLNLNDLLYKVPFKAQYVL